MYMLFVDIDFSSFYDFSGGFYNCSGILCFSYYSLNILLVQIDEFQDISHGFQTCLAA